MDARAWALLALIVWFLTSFPVGVLYAPTLKGMTGRTLNVCVLVWAVILLLCIVLSYAGLRYLAYGKPPSPMEVLFMPAYYVSVLLTAVFVAQKREHKSSRQA